RLRNQSAAVAVVFGAMDTHFLAQPLVLELGPPADAPTDSGESRAEFEARFAAELLRLEGARRDLSGPQADSLLSALGAAGVREWQLALAFLDAAARSNAAARPRRAALTLGMLRRRFQLVMSPVR